uniref:Fungal lipase-like domain-containing protein n=1 Tax=Panagrolaimus sp. PS1159 TaxID=55785 RepID=A0AC35FXZ5_9BILA
MILQTGSADDFQVIEEAGSIFNKLDPFIVGGKVNSYFYNAFLKLWNAGIRDDFLKLKNANPTFELWVTGHSLGAAMASLCAAEIVKSGYFSANKTKLITFGQPRTGNKDYAEAHDLLMNYSYRVVHANDIVPHLPTDGFENYRHHKSEVWFNNAMLTSESGYIECDEDESKLCSDGVFDLSIDDHRSYYGKDIMTWALNGCKY